MLLNSLYTAVLLIRRRVPLFRPLRLFAMVAQMDARNRALCGAFRNPREGTTEVTLADIVSKKLVVCKDRQVPSEGAILKAAKQYFAEEQQRGRKEGWRKTSKVEDLKILHTFKR